MVYVGALTALLDMDLEVLKSAVADQLKGKEKLVAANMEAVALGREYAAQNFDCPLPIRVRAAEGAKGKILVSGNDAAGPRRHLRRRHGVRLVSDHAVDLAGRGLREVRQAPARDQGRPAPLRHRAGGGRAGRHRRRHRRRLERRALVHGHLRPRHLADERVPGPRLLRRGAGGAVQHPARRPLDRHADAHAAVRHHLLRLCLARRHQARAAVPARTPPSASRWARRPSTWPSGCRRRSSSCPTSTSA